MLAQKLGFLCLVSAVAAELPHHHPQHRAPPELLRRIAHSNPAILRGADGAAESTPGSRPFSAGLRVTPAALGADPTGREDSWPALDAALRHCLTQSAISPNGYFPGEDTTPKFGPIRDMGGCFIDLEGGECKCSCSLFVFCRSQKAALLRRPHLQAARAARDERQHAVRLRLARRRAELRRRLPLRHRRGGRVQVPARLVQPRHQLPVLVPRRREGRLRHADQQRHGRHDRPRRLLPELHSVRPADQRRARGDDGSLLARRDEFRLRPRAARHEA